MKRSIIILALVPVSIVAMQYQSVKNATKELERNSSADISKYFKAKSEQTEHKDAIQIRLLAAAEEALEASQMQAKRNKRKIENSYICPILDEKGIRLELIIINKKTKTRQRETRHWTLVEGQVTEGPMSVQAMLPKESSGCCVIS